MFSHVLFLTFIYQTLCLPNVFHIRDSFLLSVSRASRNQNEYVQSERGQMLQSVEQLLESRCLDYGDGNSKSLTTKHTKLLLPKGIYRQMFFSDTLDCLTYNILMMIWKKMNETGLHNFPTRRTSMPASITKFMTCCTISSAHPALVSDIIGWTTLSYPSSTNDFLV